MLRIEKSSVNVTEQEQKEEKKEMGKILDWFKKLGPYMNMGYKFIKKAEEAGVLTSILDAVKDQKLTYAEMIDIGTRLCKASGIELDKKGIKL